MKISLTIGRDSSSCQILLPDHAVKTSRVHAVLTLDEQMKLYILDKSTNGTFVNDKKIDSNHPHFIHWFDDVSFAKEVELDWAEVERLLSMNQFQVGIDDKEFKGIVKVPSMPPPLPLPQIKPPNPYQ
jgi:pSer/pThr/pTyr-binding forkhead associated (FHA) protein